MFFRKLFLKFKRWRFYKITGFYPENIKRLVYCQKYLEKNQRKNVSYKDYLKKMGDIHAKSFR